MRGSAQYGDRAEVFQGLRQIVASKAVEPVQVFPAAQPGELPLGQLTRGNDAARFHINGR